MRRKSQKPANGSFTVGALALALIMFFAQAASSQSSSLTSNSTGNYPHSNNAVLVSTPSAVILNGSSVEIELDIDFTDILMGGSIRLDYDTTALEFVSFSFAEGGPEPILADFTQFPLGAYVSWGWFQDEPYFGVLGAHSIGTLTLIARSLGVASVVSSAVPHGTAAGPLVGPGDQYTPYVGTPLQVSYGQTSLYVVPEPASAGMLLLGLILLTSLGKTGSRNRP